MVHLVLPTSNIHYVLVLVTSAKVSAPRSPATWLRSLSASILYQSQEPMASELLSGFPSITTYIPFSGAILFFSLEYGDVDI
ncbi:uncharacterized protein EI90DRAFT_3071230 [Cantharellus anzutake]|uniref:uncharacterized protein n=1 Tax=Cantharellus anzutake TaxID=1750568 RepID=UPI0019034522|nr:uncharacterized protein EI90DRAFT_3071230 [Cantharellus anzutake]KAF8326032.1 hypothetical protein EI90DRAFT_3071230 [Cantharellus anzutake]